MRILFLTHRLPYAPDRGDRIRAFHILEMLRSRADVDLVSLVHSAAEAAQVDLARAMASSVTVVRTPTLHNYARAALALGSRLPLTHALLNAPDLVPALADVCARRPPDVVLAYCSGMAKFALQPPLAGLPLVLDLVDVDSRKWRDLSATTPPPLRWIYAREASCLGRFESYAIRHADATVVINDREAAVARTLSGGGGSICVASNGIDQRNFHPAAMPVSTARVIFCGVLDYRPNEDGALWLVRHVWPAVRASRPDAVLTLVGPNPTRRLRAACASDPQIEITGRVPDVRERLWRSAVAVAPLHVARGMQNKVLEAVAAGLPTVVTSAVADGLPHGVLPACEIADNAPLFAARVIELLGLPPAARRARAGLASLDALTWTAVLEPLWSALELAARRARDTVKN
jgi:sugar transferase (PEP-CTERM/EpsH1 system associated)